MHQCQIVRDSSTLDMLAGTTVRFRADRSHMFFAAWMRTNREAADGWLRAYGRTAAGLEVPPGRADRCGDHRLP
jgi:hypothetical protein